MNMKKAVACFRCSMRCDWRALIDYRCPVSIDSIDCLKVVWVHSKESTKLDCATSTEEQNQHYCC